MIPVSVVIIAKNEAEIIGCSIAKAKLITDDIVVVDNGSTDGTLQIALDAGCRVYQRSWNGYAANKNKGIELAKYDWILSLDADEVPDEELIASLYRLKPDDARTVYDIKFKSYFGKKQIRFGKWGRDHHIRLFNRVLVKWSESPVHETLALPGDMKCERLTGHLHHYSVKDINDFSSKSINYARLSAKKYHLNGKKTTFIKLYFSPLFNFIKNYILYLGFLDGRHGWEIASLTVKHTRLKYLLLQRMECLIKEDKVYAEENFLVEY
jgi:glycosyltransferase involved in cell wall biosynthesis